MSTTRAHGMEAPANEGASKQGRKEGGVEGGRVGAALTLRSSASRRNRSAFSRLVSPGFLSPSGRCAPSPLPSPPSWEEDDEPSLRCSSASAANPALSPTSSSAARPYASLASSCRHSPASAAPRRAWPLAHESSSLTHWSASQSASLKLSSRVYALARLE